MISWSELIYSYEVHPYAKLAWAVLSVPFTMLQAQIERDKKLKELAQAINGAYAILTRLQSAQNIGAHYQNEIVTRLVMHTMKCGTFICEECSKHQSFVGRAATNFISLTDVRMKEFKDGFDDLRRELSQAVTVEDLLEDQRNGATVRDLGKRANCIWTHLSIHWIFSYTYPSLCRWRRIRTFQSLPARNTHGSH
ncbi:hypothetical protein SISSUDRAFT_314521 [Sistotremastrum suecicum HHB10207 ss-3]|uniref:Uncharacterized protein n=1 Tax=Sistotremastrum suecicum HHB10207 ss-3 TaxID=1314776 RepID=A0A165ZAK0_9AGAM|nr:hypothetical protein SISSUDRAFT_314521 [Sistotremastrum suecicum HHB10207 ss-3]